MDCPGTWLRPWFLFIFSCMHYAWYNHVYGKSYEHMDRYYRQRAIIRRTSVTCGHITSLRDLIGVWMDCPRSWIRPWFLSNYSCMHYAGTCMYISKTMHVWFEATVWGLTVREHGFPERIQVQSGTLSAIGWTVQGLGLVPGFYLNLPACIMHVCTWRKSCTYGPK